MIETSTFLDPNRPTGRLGNRALLSRHRTGVSDPELEWASRSCVVLNQGLELTLLFPLATRVEIPLPSAVIHFQSPINWSLLSSTLTSLSLSPQPAHFSALASYLESQTAEIRSLNAKRPTIYVRGARSQVYSIVFVASQHVSHPERTAPKPPIPDQTAKTEGFRRYSLGSPPRGCGPRWPR